MNTKIKDRSLQVDIILHVTIDCYIKEGILFLSHNKKKMLCYRRKTINIVNMPLFVIRPLACRIVLFIVLLFYGV